MENSGSSAVLQHELQNFNLCTSFRSLQGSNLASEELWSWYSLFLGSPFRHRFPTFKPPGESGRASVSAFTMVVTWHVGVLLLFTRREKKRNAENRWNKCAKRAHGQVMPGKISANICYRGCKLFKVQHANSQRNPTFFEPRHDDYQLMTGKCCWNIMWKTHKVSINSTTDSNSMGALILVTMLYFHTSMIHIYISSDHSTEAILYAWPQLSSRCSSSKHFFGEIII